MNIVFYNRYRGDCLYGVELWMLRMAQELAGRGHAVVFACRRGSALEKAALERGLAIEAVPEIPAFGLAAVFQLRALLRARRTEAVCVKTWKELYRAAFAGRGLGCRIFCRRGANGDIADRLQHRLAVTLCRPRILVPSEALRREFGAVPWMRGRPIHVIPHGVDMRRFQDAPPAAALPPCPFRFVFVGRLEPVKGVDVLLRAWPQVLARAPGRRLLLVGAEEHANYRVMARSAGVADSVEWAGYQQDVRPWLAAANALVLPSRREGGGLAALEAMAMGLPVIGSNVGGIPEYVLDGATGRIVPPADERALAEAMTEFALAPEKVRVFGLAARRRVETEFSLDSSVARLEHVLLERDKTCGII